MRERLMIVLRRAVEAALPWYDPRNEAAKDRRVAIRVREAEQLASTVRGVTQALRDHR